MQDPISWWIGFNLFVLAMLAIDLGVFHRKSHEIKFKEAIGWSVFWIGLALAFNVGLYFYWPAGHSDYSNKEAALAFLTGYLVEKSLSVDNIFVMMTLFAYFQVPSKYQHKLLFWGIIGALVMRGVFIFAGVALLNKFHWMIYVFGAFLIFTGAKMAWSKNEEVQPEKNPVLKLARRFIPLTSHYVEGHFFTRQNGRRLATPMFIALLMVESTDLMFAVDSIPAILAITHDTFIVYTSNVFAILGLRALYFAISGVLRIFEYLHYGLASILVFIGIKMILVYWEIKIPVGWSLSVVAGILAISIIVSLLLTQKDDSTATSP